MNPLILKTIFDIGSKIVDHKKIASATNATTVAGVGAGSAAFLVLVQSDDPILQVVGAIAIAISGIMVMYKSKTKPEPSRQVKKQAITKSRKKAAKSKK